MIFLAAYATRSLSSAIDNQVRALWTRMNTYGVFAAQNLAQL